MVADIESETEFCEIYSKCRSNTITSLARLYAMYQAVTKVVESSVPGDIVECGVWRGGVCTLAAYTR
jgi:hypothetical protein